MFAIFDYGTFPTSDMLGTLGLRAHSLWTWADVVAVAREDGTFDAQALTEIEAFLGDPPSLVGGARWPDPGWHQLFRRFG